MLCTSLVVVQGHSVCACVSNTNVFIIFMQEDRTISVIPLTGVEMEGKEKRIVHCGSCGKQCLFDGLPLDGFIRCHQCLEVPVTRKEEQLKN